MARRCVAQRSALAEGSLLRVVVDDVALCLAHASDGQIYAVADSCTHEQTPLSDGELLGMTVECPLHGSRFDVRTGEVSGLPAELPVATYPIVVEGDDVYVEF